MTFAEPLFAWLFAVPLLWLVGDAVRAASPEALRWPGIRRLWAGPGGVKSATRGSLAAPRWRLFAGACFAITALMRPQFGRIEERVHDTSREVLVALDLSRSMLAEDVKPNRLTRARLLIESLLDKLKGERVGLLLFSGTAFLQSPLSADYEVLREFLPALDPEYLPEGGSDYDRMLKAALDSYSTQAGADRYLIVLSDGEAQTDDWRRHLETLQKRGVRVIALGVGTPAGSVMPAKGGGFVKDERGAVVMSRLEPATLQQLASATGGAYVDASTWVDLSAVLAQTISRGQKGVAQERTTWRMSERFQWFLAPALFFLLWSYWIEFPVRPRARDIRRAGPPPIPRAAPADRAIATTVSLLALGFVLATPPRAAAAKLTPPSVSAAPAPGGEAVDPALPKIVQRLAGQPDLSAGDCAHLARETLAFGENEKAAQRPLAPGIVHDGLAAVDLGERLNPKAENWPELRAALLKLLEKPPEQNQPQKPDEPQKDQKKDEQQKKQDSQSRQDQKSKQDEPQSGQQKPEPKSDEPKSGQPDPAQPSEGEKSNQPPQQPAQKAFDPADPKAEPPPPQPGEPNAHPQPTQTIGGEKPADAELEKNPQLAVPLQKLEEARGKDSPAQLFKLLQRDEPQPAKPKKDW